MTSNQINYAATREQARHDEATENETNRHNLATEELEAHRLALAESELDLKRRTQTATERYQQRDLELREQYNTWYEQYQTATTEQKLEIEKKLAQINQDKTNNEKWYNEEMVRLRDEQNALIAEENSIKARVTEETKRHNEAQETVSAYQQILNERRIEYENTFWNETVGIQEAKNAIDLIRTSTENEYKLGSLSIERQLAPFKMWDLWTKGDQQSHSGIKPLIDRTWMLEQPHDMAPHGGKYYEQGVRAFFDKIGIALQ